MNWKTWWHNFKRHGKGTWPHLSTLYLVVVSLLLFVGLHTIQPPLTRNGNCKEAWLAIWPFQDLAMMGLHWFDLGGKWFLGNHPSIHPFIHPSIMTKWENSIHVQRIIAMVNWIGGPTLGKAFGGHIGNLGNTLGTGWEYAGKTSKKNSTITSHPFPSQRRLKKNTKLCLLSKWWFSTRRSLKKCGYHP
jgi:hypothetical protein